MTFRDWLSQTWSDTPYGIDSKAIKHGSFESWLAALDQLPDLGTVTTRIDKCVRIGEPEDDVDQHQLVDIVERLVPWRKGPFNLFGLPIDSEWRSDLKWDRLRAHIDWLDKSVLDVGCGNGYFGYRMLDAGAKSVVGLDGYFLFAIQAALLQWFSRSPTVVVPRRFNGLDQHQFDVVLSMGVVYHQRDPFRHMSDIVAACKQGGTLVVESIVADSDFKPYRRVYAGMPNVTLLPSVTTLFRWMEQVGLIDIQVADVSTTTVAEQRQTALMPFRSLSDSLDPADPSKTIEGYPAPQRAMLIAQKP